MRRELQNSTIPVPRFQSGGGLLSHTGGTHSHGGMIDYPRFPIPELHLGKFPDSVEFRSWKANFQTEVCSKSADPHLTMHWIKEVEMAKSIDELLTSRSIVGRNDFTDYGMVDAMIVSALKRLLVKHIHFRKRVCVEEQRAQKYDRFLRGKDSQNCSVYVCRKTTSKISTFDRSSSTVSKRYAFRCDPGRIVHVKNTGLVQI